MAWESRTPSHHIENLRPLGSPEQKGAACGLAAMLVGEFLKGIAETEPFSDHPVSRQTRDFISKGDGQKLENLLSKLHESCNLSTVGWTEYPTSRPPTGIWHFDTHFVGEKNPPEVMDLLHMLSDSQWDILDANPGYAKVLANEARKRIKRDLEKLAEPYQQQRDSNWPDWR